LYLLLLENCNLQSLWEVTEVILDFITCFKIENELSYWVFMFILNSNGRIDIEKNIQINTKIYFYLWR